MHHCPKCESTAITLDAHVDGERTYSCVRCSHEWQTLEVSKAYMADLLQRSLTLAAIQQS
jgi:transposase-like protein